MFSTWSCYKAIQNSCKGRSVTLPLNWAKSVFQYAPAIPTLTGNKAGGEAKVAAAEGGKSTPPVGGKLSWGWWRRSLCLQKDHAGQA